MDQARLNLPKGYISASQISTWKYNKGQYIDRYIFGIPTKESPELLFGQKVSKWMEGGDFTSAPAVLKKLRRYAVPEYKLQHTFHTPQGDFDFLGYVDSYDPKLHKIREYKTGRVKWDQHRADEHLQTLLYAAIIYEQTKRIPRVWIDWIPTKQEDGISVPAGGIQTFKVNITTAKMLAALKELRDTAIAIDAWHTEYQKTANEMLAV